MTRLELVQEGLAIADETIGPLHKLAMLYAETASDGFFTIVRSSCGDFLMDTTTGKPVPSDIPSEAIECFLCGTYMAERGLDRMPFEVDSLDLGFITVDGFFVPAEEWR